MPPPAADYVTDPPLELIRAWPSTVPISRSADPSTINDILRRQAEQINYDIVNAATRPKQRRRFRFF